MLMISIGRVIIKYFGMTPLLISVAPFRSPEDLSSLTRAGMGEIFAAFALIASESLGRGYAAGFKGQIDIIDDSLN